MFNREAFEQEKRANALAQSKDQQLQDLALELVVKSDKYQYGYQWTWLGLPMIQLTTDMIVTQEIIWQTKPDLIIETGIAWGGSIVFYASLCELLDNGRVIGIDTVLPESNQQAIMNYPFANRIQLLAGSSTDDKIIKQVTAQINYNDKVMVLLDSNHSHDHVLTELRKYAPLVSNGQYLVVSDTIVEDIPKQEHRPRDWGPGSNPKTALQCYLQETDRFIEDEYINNKMLTTYTPNGYLKCVK